MPGWREVATYALRRGGRRLLDLVTAVVCRLVYGARRRCLPTPASPLLLESAGSLARRIRRGEIRSLDVVEAYIARIQAVQPDLNAVVDHRFQEARAEAVAADQLVASGADPEILARDLPLLGVPFTSKNSVAIQGLAQDVGLVSRKGYRAPEDSAAVGALRASGAVPLAVTNVSEVCLWWEANNKLYGRTCNPYDTTRGVGGSSGGEGALIAAAGSVIGIGNDIGGSIRIPAFINGIFGHKPSHGVVSNRGQFPEPTGQLEHYLTAGPMCRYAHDLELVLRALAGPQWAAHLQLELPVPLADLRVFYMEGDGGNPCVSPIHPDVTAGFRKVLEYFKVKLGVPPEPVTLDLRQGAQIWGHKMLAGTKTDCASVLGGPGGYQPAWELAKWVVGLSDHTFPAVGAGVVEAIERNRHQKRDYLFKKYDMLESQFHDMLKENCIFLFPTLPEPAPYHNRPLFQMHNCNFLGLFNVLGLPVTQCPLGLGDEGLPVGVQVVAGKFQDRLTLAIAKALEQEFGGWVDPSAPPPL